MFESCLNYFGTARIYSRQNHPKNQKNSKTCSGAILQNLHRFCRLLQKVKRQLFHFVSFTEQFCMKFHDACF
ncbi:hypothetical protein BpHYR1_020905 [Brachionus plicatilis]|uniref:Uncharacterized protein n=1 Tax=Brachionus plicatilis TaxID=10195 RepID=A0A3M7REN0_BRAPC|nr:hypothetical protein BpHYR1_020905 [Brachionus plicatilis]